MAKKKKHLRFNYDAVKIRYLVMIALFCILGALILGKAFVMMHGEQQKYWLQVSKRFKREGVPIFAKRGNIVSADGQVLVANGGNLARVASIEMDECDPRLANCHIEVACDVDNPLVGARGAAAVFGPQKGATPEMVEELEQGLQNYARVLQQQTEINVCQMAGGGAAGGMGIAAAVFLNADIKPGIEIVLNAVNLAQAVQGAALVITGEGRIDSQTAGGKAPLGVASVAKQFNVPVIGIAGVLGDGVEVVHQYGIDAVFSILPRLAPLAEVLASGETNLFNSARNIACAIKIGQGIKN